ncbi:S-adenosyl-L-methionine-dependent methyltransferase [Neolentinus lepideus HHB14362 ss-1]|uniref:S-adenosyl-L-methionine-dependent methyltransferase n=1 Tax=Neolentinus lepideus HHB14362 ss-1 TaxID=1314782 RepID=A0A165UH03_9AGAM|nr:S-adenosyl-L-methionine-dependent methyltransferase [Neolentinus lepideus HHB14362 ss-1]
MTRRKKAAWRPKSSKPWNDNRTDIVSPEQMKNANLEKYYKMQNILPAEEWNAFMERLKMPLPTTFRVAGFRETATVLNDLIKTTYIPTLSNAIDGEEVEPPAQLPWYPDGLAWQFNVSKQVLRKNPDFKRFHSFLVFETEIGNISRQEAVSMLPPLLLDVQPHHVVMDMCAAPGSKTAQLLEALHTPSSASTGTGTGTTAIPPGLLLANDSDHKRTHLLIHQSARLPSPSLLVTNLDASIFPTIRVGAECVGGGNGTRQLLFDRILCDVPCSGDGTLRKNVGIWLKWGVGDGNGLHSLQLRILQRAMRLLKPGGRIVYSTCSLNPIENEAVVAAALRSMPDFMLVPTSSSLPSLHRRPGLKSWTPAFTFGGKRELQFFATYSEYVAALGEKDEKKYTESMWPPEDQSEEAWDLTRCMRIYPHLQDTGGFFIAVLEKKALETLELKKRQADDTAPEIATKKPKLEEDVVLSDAAGAESSAIPTPSAVKEEEKPDVKGGGVPNNAKSLPLNKTKGKQSEETGGTFKENPYTFLSPDDPIVKACIDKLHLIPSFPDSNIFVRNPFGEPARSLYLTNDIVQSVILNNDYNKIRLMTAGTKLFVKQEGAKSSADDSEESNSKFRILSEGLPVVYPFVKPETVMDANLVTLRSLLEVYHPLCENFQQPFKDAIVARSSGCHILRFSEEKNDSGSLTHELVLPIWKSSVSLSLMIDKKAKSALSLRVFGQDITTAGREAASNQKVRATSSGTSIAAKDEETDQVVIAEDPEQANDSVNET